MTKPKKEKLPAKQFKVQIADSLDPDTIRDTLATSVDGWADMSATVQDEIVRLNVDLRGLHRPPRLSVEVDGNKTAIDPNEKNPQLHTMRLMKTLCSASADFTNYFLGRLITHLQSQGSMTAENLNAALAFIDGLAPENEAEAMLAMQMFISNDAALRALRTMNSSGWADTAAQFGNLSVKLMRTYTMQAEALAKLRRGGVQRVEHYYIDNRGGQAVIADNVTTGGQNGKIEHQSHATRNTGFGPSVWGKDAQGVALPVASGAGQEAMPDARWAQSGSA